MQDQHDLRPLCALERAEDVRREPLVVAGGDDDQVERVGEDGGDEL